MEKLYRESGLYYTNICNYYFKNVEGIDYLSKWHVNDKEKIYNIENMINHFIQAIKDIKIERIILNPSFEEYSSKVGGADADIIINDTLIDFKTKNKLEYSWQDIVQIIGYSSMAKAIGMDIKRAGIYYARFGLFAIIDIKAILGEKFFK